MIENEIVPLYFAYNSKVYSPDWIQYIKNSIAHIAPRFTMKRMIDDYIERFYTKEDKRYKSLIANHFAKAKEIAAWKQEVASKWDLIKALDVKLPEISTMTAVNGTPYETEVVLDTAGLAEKLGVEMVVYTNENGEMKFKQVTPLTVLKKDGNVVTYHLNSSVKDAGIFRYGYRIYPNNPDLPHRQDFAYVQWI